MVAQKSLPPDPRFIIDPQLGITVWRGSSPSSPDMTPFRFGLVAGGCTTDVFDSPGTETDLFGALLGREEEKRGLHAITGFEITSFLFS